MVILKYSDGKIDKTIKIKSEEDQEELNKKMSESKEEQKIDKKANSNVPFWTK